MRTYTRVYTTLRYTLGVEETNPKVYPGVEETNPKVYPGVKGVHNGGYTRV